MRFEQELQAWIDDRRGLLFHPLNAERDASTYTVLEFVEMCRRLYLNPAHELGRIYAKAKGRTL